MVHQESSPRIANTPSLFQPPGCGRRGPSTVTHLDVMAILERPDVVWVSAKQLAGELHTTDRAIRQAAHDSGGRVLGGQRGYALTIRASLAEVNRVTSALLSQAARMRERVAAIERIRHGVRAEEAPR